MENLPFPRTPIGWLAAVVATLFSFQSYYFVVYPGLEEQYHLSFYTSAAPQSGQPDVRVSIPRYLSDFVDRELPVVVTNNTDNGMIALVVVSAEHEPLEGASLSPATVIMRAAEDANDAGSAPDGSSSLDFGAIAPRMTVTRTLSVRVENARQGEHVDFDFSICASPLTAAAGGSSVYQSCTWRPISFDGPTISTVNSAGTMLQSFIKTILLPPWLNGLLPVLSLVAAWLMEPRLLKYKAPPPGFLSRIRDWVRQRLGIPPLQPAVANDARGGWTWLWQWPLIVRSRSWAALLLLVFAFQTFVFGGAFLGLRLVSSIPAAPVQSLFVCLSLLAAPGILLVVSVSRRIAEEPGRRDRFFPEDMEDGRGDMRPPGGGNGRPDGPGGAPSDGPKGPLGAQAAHEEASKDLDVVLNHLKPDQSAAALEALLASHPNLPDFGPRYMRVAQRSREHRRVLHASVRNTPSGDLRMITDHGLLTDLLELAQEDQPVCFGDGKGTLEALILARTQAADQTLRDALAAGRLQDRILDELRASDRTASELLALFAVLPQVGEGQLQRTLACLERRLEALPDFHEQFRQFLEHAQRTLNGRLLRKLQPPLADRLLTLCKHIAARRPEFAEWFVYNELPGLAADQESLNRHYAEIVLAARATLRGLPIDNRPDVSEGFQFLVEDSQVRKEERWLGMTLKEAIRDKELLAAENALRLRPPG